MLLSMTGYGKAEYIFAEHKTTVEIRTLNSNWSAEKWMC